MTRETKIGLLIGLLFIIVIGVLLSDHLTNANNPQPASLVSVGEQALRATQTPGGAEKYVGQPVPPADVTPHTTVLTSADMQPKQPPQTDVAVGVGSPRTIVIDSNANNNVIKTVKPVMDDPAVVVGEHGTMSVIPETVPVTPTVTTAPPVAAEKALEYKAQPGDNVAKWAKKFYGADTKANRDLIIKANVSLRTDPTKIVVGRTYLIPPKPVAPAADLTRTTLATVSPTTLPATADKLYVVKEGDNLWKIAREQCHDSRAVDEIRKLNRDVLKNGDNLKLGMKLHLPVK